MSQNQMFCYQCDQTAKGQGCTVAGVCGKTADVSTLQDLLVYMLRGLGQLSTEARKAGVKDETIDLFTCEALFVTLTNVNFDPEAIVSYIIQPEAGKNHRSPNSTGKTIRYKL